MGDEEVLPAESVQVDYRFVSIAYAVCVVLCGFLYSLQLLSIRDRLAFDFIGTNPNYDRNKFYDATKRVDEIQKILFEEE